MKIKIKTSSNIRNYPDLLLSSDVGNLDPGSTLEVIGDDGDFWKVSAFVHKSVAEPLNTTSLDKRLFFKVGHDRDIGPIWRKNVPEVYHFDQSQPTKLTRAWQEFIMELNPLMDGKGFRSLLKWDRAFTNISGYDHPSGKPRADFINHRDEDEKLPVVDKCRVCGGATLAGKIVNGKLVIETLDGSKPPPSVSSVLAKPWLFFTCFIVKPDGSVENFPQSGGRPVYFPLVASGIVTVRLNTIIPNKPYPYITGPIN